jgi:hypothetical protein
MAPVRKGTHIFGITILADHEASPATLAISC